MYRQQLGFADGGLIVFGFSTDATGGTTTPFLAALNPRTGARQRTAPDGGPFAIAGRLIYAQEYPVLTIRDLATGARVSSLPMPAGILSTGIEIANGWLYLGYDVYALQEPAILRGEVQAYSLPFVPPSLLTLDDTAAEISYDPTWKTGRNAGDYRGTDHYTETGGGTATLKFTGPGLRLWFSLAAHHGIAGVTIDGQPEIRVDQYAAVRSDGRISWTSRALTTGQHTVHIRASGDRDPAATARVITLDRVELGRN